MTTDTASLLQPLKPKEGRFLPAAAALGGLLFLAPEGHQPAQHDVLRLDSSLPVLRLQQGYISCEPKADVSRADCLNGLAAQCVMQQSVPWHVEHRLRGLDTAVRQG